MLTINIIVIIFFYLIGSLPFALILTKLFGFGDIRKIGSGNIGATNVLRTGNKKLALVVLILDFLKGFIPLIILKNYLVNNENDTDIYYIISLFAIIGHIFPIWLKFKGGKGVATYIGYIFALNYIYGLIFIFSWMIIALITKYSSLSSILSLLILPIIIYFFHYDSNNLLILLAIGLLIISKHYSNILRLFNKTENKIRF